MGVKFQSSRADVLPVLDECLLQDMLQLPSQLVSVLISSVNEPLFYVWCFEIRGRTKTCRIPAFEELLWTPLPKRDP